MASSFLWHTQEADSIAHELKTDLEQGLSGKEAASRLSTYGLNETPGTDRVHWTNIFLHQQISLMIPILILVCAVMILRDMWIGAFTVIGILVVNVILSSYQSIRAGKILKSIKKFADRATYAKAFRNGNIKLVKTTELVPGDIICFETGDLIPADGRVIEADDLAVDESIIAKKNNAAEKDVGVLDEDVPVHKRDNMVYSGAIVVRGSGRAIVTSTGAQTQIAQLSGNLNAKAEEAHWSSLGASLEKKGLWFASASVLCSAIIWGIIYAAGVSLLSSVMVGFTFLLALWPIGLYESAIMCLVSGMRRLSERDIAIRKFSGAEALASAKVICSDKAGIMTQNQITVKRIFVDGRIIDMEGQGYDPDSGGFPPDAEEENPDLPLLLTVAAMASNAEVKNTPEGWNIVGDPTEGALVVAAMKGGIHKDELGLSLTKVAEIPFDPERKRMTTIYKSSRDEIFVFTKGALETVLDISTNLQLHGYVDNLDIRRHRAIWAVNHSFARDRMHNIAFAYCQLEKEPEKYTIKTVERNMVFIGIAGIVDPLRPDAKPAVSKCLKGGVQPVIIADDNVETTSAIAYDLGIISDGVQVLTGEELDILGEREYESLAGRFTAYADISPGHRLRIVRTLRDQGAVTALIASRVNDSVAIREADIGITTGKSAFSVATEAADLALMDNNFAAAANAIEDMRGAYGNAKKIARYLLSGSMATASAILIALIISIFQRGFFDSSLQSLQVLLLHVLMINLLGGSIPALAMILNPVTDGTMREGPYTRGRIFEDELKSRIVIRGMLTAFIALIAFAFSLGPQSDQGRAVTAAFSVLVFSQLAFAFQCRLTPGEGFFRKYLTNKLLLILACLAMLAQAAIIYIPALNQIFKTAPLLPIDWLPIAFAFILCSLPLDELFNTRVETESEPEDKPQKDKPAESADAKTDEVQTEEK